MGNRYLMVVSIERLLVVERYRQSRQAAEATHSLRDPHRPVGPEDRGLGVPRLRRR